MNSSAIEPDRGESPSATNRLIRHTDSVFESFFERSFDAVWLFDPQAGVFVDCNQAAVRLVGAEDKQQLLRLKPEDISPSIQPNGSTSNERTTRIIALVEQTSSARFDWMASAPNGDEIPLEVALTRIQWSGRQVIQALMLAHIFTHLLSNAVKYSEPGATVHFAVKAKSAWVRP